MTMADRIVVMHDGRVEQIGSPLELYDNPANTFVAGFIGSPAMNFINGRLRRDGDRASVEAADGTQLPLNRPVAAQDGQEVIYGVRPEHLEVAGDGTAGTMPATVTVVEPTGADTYVFGTIAGTQVCAVFNERYNFEPDQLIHLAPKGGITHVFDAATGNKVG
jgi:multiple sugar transport system ATP-binding protein